MTHASDLHEQDQGENLMGYGILHYTVGYCLKMADDGKGTRGYTLMEAATDATDMWYNEIKNFNFEDYQSHRGVVRHFTQVNMK